MRWTDRSALDVAAVVERGLDLLEGIQDRNGRAVVRRNPRLAVRLLLGAAQMGDVSAIGSVGYAYDRGLGVRRNRGRALLWYRRAARQGSSAAATNIATVYRDARKFRLAFRWWKLSADLGDGDAAVDAGYCYQYGIGVRRDPIRARQLFRSASASGDITAYRREEALFHLALSFLDEGRVRLALPLLSRAAADGDFPQASQVIQQIQSGAAIGPCRCRRHIDKKLPGHARCPHHPK